MKKLIKTIVFILILLFTQAVYAEDQQIAVLDKNIPTPFAGYLLSADSMSQLVAKINSQEQFCDEKIKLNVSTTQKIDEVQCKKHIADITTINDAAVAIRDSELLAQQKKIDILTKHIKELESQSTLTTKLLYAGGGVVAGVVTTIATVFLVEKL